ncbi:MAG TPA: helix-turn-helix transcriptional regulator [Ramlibacter sp.]|uniref:helix-turn-helix transcriptional regulator n=1 Tax=Ramlibacter sp. TaxID=1917967 RepID=UPI002D2B51C7|nr:helix-turn-helix transcriptional regulator [Ramlibacter sp.]HZY20141.1 helix-turn-helix transcriptional regulator [Ramlibacter sp.]
MTPVNFDSVDLDTVLSEWLGALQEFPVEAVVVLGPDPFGGREDRQVLAVHPPALGAAARGLAQSREFGVTWRDSDASLVAWQSLSRPDAESGDWRALWRGQGFRSLVRVGLPLPGGRAFECFLFSRRELNDRADAAALVWSTLNVWPTVKRSIGGQCSRLSPRERECLALAFEGLTARESAERLQCSDRTVNYHLSNAMSKLKVDNKLGAIQRACWLGAI